MLVNGIAQHLSGWWDVDTLIIKANAQQFDWLYIRLHTQDSLGPKLHAIHLALWLSGEMSSENLYKSMLKLATAVF